MPLCHVDGLTGVHLFANPALLKRRLALFAFPFILLVLATLVPLMRFVRLDTARMGFVLPLISLLWVMPVVVLLSVAVILNANAPKGEVVDSDVVSQLVLLIVKR
jgi:cytochrome c-type biogenesis protein CcmH/NrfF